MKFISKIQSGYRDITYHNKTHAADLTQTCYSFLTQGNMMEIAAIDDMQLAAIIIGGSIHDYDHPGFNNVYLIETNDELAFKYNDVSVLENHHLACSFAILKEEPFDIFKNFSDLDFKAMRKLLIQLVLSTDMAKHFNE